MEISNNKEYLLKKIISNIYCLFIVIKYFFFLKVCCPACNQYVDISEINEHMDKCTKLEKTEVENQKSKNTPPSKAPPKKIVITAKVNTFFKKKSEDDLINIKKIIIL